MIEVILVILGMFCIGRFFVLIVEGISPEGHMPQSPEEERDMLMGHYGLTEEEADEYMYPPGPI